MQNVDARYQIQMKWEDEVPCLLGNFLVIFLDSEDVFDVLHRQLRFIFLCRIRVSIPNTVPRNRGKLPAWPESFASAYSTAFARHTEPISLSKFRTPDSLVYDSIILDTTSWVNSTCPSPRPSIPRQHSQNFQGSGVLTGTNLLWNQML